MRDDRVQDKRRDCFIGGVLGTKYRKDNMAGFLAGKNCAAIFGGRRNYYSRINLKQEI
jgi:hypothetical protein